MLCNENTVLSIQQYVHKLTEFLSLYMWIVDAYVSDFFTKDHWSSLPLQWRESFTNTEPPDLAWLLNTDSPPPKVWPLSLLAFRQCTQAYSLSRSQQEVKVQELTQLSSSEICGEKVLNSHLPELSEPKSDFGNSGCLTKHVKPKKLHEIKHLGKTLRTLGDICDCQNIVDVGAGQGHLSRYLTFQHGFKVTTVEAEGCHAPKAVKYDRDAQRQINKVQQQKGCPENENQADLPHHVTCYITADTTQGDFLDIVQTSFRRSTPCNQCQTERDSIKKVKLDCVACDKRIDDGSFCQDSTVVVTTADTQTLCSESHLCKKCQMQTCMDRSSLYVQQGNDSRKQSNNCDSYYEGCKYCDQNREKLSSLDSSGGSTCKNFLLTGLHACGDLTPTMLRVFASCEDIRGLASVGCCYMKLSTQQNSDNDPVGYPTSEFVRQLPHSALSYEAREMACHFADSYMHRLRDSPPALRLHCYRAALQWIVLQLQPEFITGAQKLSLRRADTLTFPQYASLGLKRLGLSSEIPDTVLEKAQCLLERWKQVVVFYTLRLCLSPVVETLILLDRQLYLYEQSLFSILKPIFEPMVSPRNFVLLARK